MYHSSIITRSPEQTRALGRCIGQRIEASLVIRLCGDLGSGKTCLVQGLAGGLGVPDAYRVTSPTYTLINEYPGRLPIFHVDLYRLQGPDDAETIGLWDIMGRDTVVAVEWAERIPEALWPREHLTIEFGLTDKDDVHRLDLKGYGLEIADLIKEAVDSWNGTTE